MEEREAVKKAIKSKCFGYYYVKVNDITYQCGNSICPAGLKRKCLDISAGNNERKFEV
jgi:hypothetical protein